MKDGGGVASGADSPWLRYNSPVDAGGGLNKGENRLQSPAPGAGGKSQQVAAPQYDPRQVASAPQYQSPTGGKDQSSWDADVTSTSLFDPNQVSWSLFDNQTGLGAGLTGGKGKGPPKGGDSSWGLFDQTAGWSGKQGGKGT